MDQEAVVRMNDLAPIPVPPRLQELARTFPTIARAESSGVLESIELLNACRIHGAHGEALAALFLLNVWGLAFADQPHLREWPTFDVMDAMGTWDAAHRKAFATWALAPWWC